MGPYILREATGEWHTNGVTRESSEVLVSHENERPYLQAKIQVFRFLFSGNLMLVTVTWKSL